MSVVNRKTNQLAATLRPIRGQSINELRFPLSYASFLARRWERFCLKQTIRTGVDPAGNACPRTVEQAQPNVSTGRLPREQSDVKMRRERNGVVGGTAARCATAARHPERRIEFGAARQARPANFLAMRGPGTERRNRTDGRHPTARGRATAGQRGEGEREAGECETGVLQDVPPLR